jgi:hypothetical protein
VTDSSRTLSATEASEVRALLAGFTAATRSQQRMTRARLRRMGLPFTDDRAMGLGAVPLDHLVASGAVSIDQRGESARARSHRIGRATFFESQWA